MGNIRQTAKEFEVFAKDCQDSSPLYEFLALSIAKHEELLTLSMFAREGQPKPNMLLGAVHHLLLRSKSHSLALYYPNIVEEPKDLTDVFRHFVNFCRTFREDIINILQTKRVQTNEVRRCAYLYPSFAYIYEQVKKPLAFIEIGTSAGLQLLWDQYSYSYQSDDVYGMKQSPVRIMSEVKGGNLPFLPKDSPPVSHRIGLDLHINDVSHRKDYLWLLSLIWPEHHDRRELFKQAAKCIHMEDLHLIEGDGIKLLPDLSKTIPPSSVICVFHTHVANQFSVAQKHQLLNEIKSIGQSRDIFHFYNNMWDGNLHLDYYIQGKEHRHTVGQANSHGKWFTWQL